MYLEADNVAFGHPLLDQGFQNLWHLVHLERQCPLSRLHLVFSHFVFRQEKVGHCGCEIE